ncbi:MAG: SDR family NAD(P)-dependent oxidoreductase [Oscillatoriales cyanobacterium C42_A2020_001]|nr:SDR family NAD(P)-dependent oxidoreductase [Leptolyngbyaceae cyanobacterium C42_A2020_001]
MNFPNYFSGKKILVTGASGFIGSHLCDALCEKEVEVHAIYRSQKNEKLNSVHWWKVDLQDPSSTQTVLNTIKPDIIYHLASHVTGSRSMEHVLPTLSNNLISTVNLLKVATEIGCSRIILAGSLEEPEADDITVLPSSPYAAAKWASSVYAQMFHDLYKTPVVVAKIFMVYVPRQNPRFLIPYVVASLLKGISPQLTSGKRLVDWIYVDDVVSGLLAMAYVSDIEGQTIDLGSGTFVTIREIVQRLVDIVNPQIAPSFGAITDRSSEQVRSANSITSFAKLNWKPKVSLNQGLKLTTDWYRENLEIALKDQSTISPSA